jgi:type I restriction enzyme, S subunit
MGEPSRTAPLFSLCEEVATRNTSGVERNLLSLSHGRIIRKDIDSADGLLPESFDGYTIAEPGDTVLRLTDLQNDQRSLRTGFVTERGLVTSAYQTLRPGASVDARFFSYSLCGMDLNKVFYAMGGGLRQSLAFQDLKRLEMPCPAHDSQRRVADFLDDQVARIEGVIAARQQQAEHADRLLWNSFVEEVLKVRHLRLPLRRVLGLVADGPFGSAFTSSDYVDDGPAVIRLGNIGFARFNGRELVRVPDDIYTRFPRCHVQAGDLLVASLGDPRNHAGRACLAPDDLGRAMVKGKCLRAQVDVGAFDPRFVAMLLSSPIGAATFALEERGSTRRMINIGILRDVALPFPSRFDQSAIADRFDDDRTVTAALAETMSGSVELLQDLKRSLITSAVSGEFDVTTADGSRVEV